MGNNPSGLAPNLSRADLTEAGDVKAAKGSKKVADDGSAAGAAAAQPPEMGDYDMPDEPGSDVANASRRSSESSLASAAAVAAAIAAASFGRGSSGLASSPGPRRGSAPAAALSAERQGRGGKVTLGRQLLDKSKKKKPSSLSSESDAVGVGSPTAAAEQRPSASIVPSRQPLLPPPTTRRPELARSDSKDSSSSSSTKSSAAAVGIRLLPVVPGKPTTIPSAGTDQTRNKELADGDDDDDTYDRLQHDVHPFKVKQAMLPRKELPVGKGLALQPSHGGDNAGGATLYHVVVPEAPDRFSATYEVIGPVCSPPSVAPATTTTVAAISGAGGSAAPLQQAAAPAADDSSSDYDSIQRNVNPVKAKQLRMQPGGILAGAGASGGGWSNQGAAAAEQSTSCSSSTAAGTVAAVLLPSARGSSELHADDDNSYDCIQRDVNPVKAKQDRPPPTVEYTCPQTTRIMSREVSAAYETVDLLSSSGEGDVGAATPTQRLSATAAAAAAAAAGALVSSGAAASTYKNGDGEEDSSYDCIQRDVSPSKVKLLKDKRQKSADDAGDSQYATSSIDAAHVGVAYHGSSSSEQGRYRGHGLPRGAAAAIATSSLAIKPWTAAPARVPLSSTAPAASFGTPAAVGLQSDAVAVRADMYSEVKSASAPRPLVAASVGAALKATQMSSPPPSVPPKHFAFLGTDFDSGVVVLEGRRGSPPANEHLEHHNPSRGPTTSSLDSAPPPVNADADLRRNRVNQLQHYENVDANSWRADATEEESFDSSSAFYASHQSLRGGQQPPMLTASPQLPRSTSGGSSRHRPNRSELDQPTSTAPTADPSSSQPARQPKLRPPNEAAYAYSEVDLAVGRPAGTTAAMPPPQLTQYRPALHNHSTQDGLLINEADLASQPAQQLSAPRSRPWVPRNVAYQDVDDVRDGLA